MQSRPVIMSKTLNGEIIAITRPIERSKYAVDIVKQFGGVPLVVPTLELKLTCTPSLMKLCKNINSLDWLILTSPASIDSIFKFCPDFKEKLKPECKIAVIGPKTGDSIESKGLNVEMMPDEYTAEGLLDSFKDYDVKGKNMGIPRTLSARKVLPDELISRGANVIVAEAYQSVIPEETSLINDLINKIIKKEISAITFTSPLTVENLFNIAGKKQKMDLKNILSKEYVLVAAIGPITGKKLHEYGIDALIPEKYTVRDMMLKLFDNM